VVATRGDYAFGRLRVVGSGERLPFERLNVGLRREDDHRTGWVSAGSSIDDREWGTSTESMERCD
jgi:hypothetical protein